ncbi:MAG: 4-hydroxy-3-methylbut-2-enyl diphosphate reductase [Pelagibacteraceae bacterium]|nr:4-hydroxy-3-methylbut-2-enyl diphosphate reductase [Pelagibacteraceae bacterium]
MEEQKKDNQLKIYLASPRGFCAGVDRAVEIVKKSLQKFGAPIYVRHEIVHNKHVVQELKEMGTIFVDELDDIEDTSRPVIFSAHGVAKKVVDDAKFKNLLYIDATCPLVSKVHREAEQLNKQGYHIFLIGHENHPEVIGTMGQIDNNNIELIQNKEDVETILPIKEKKYAYITQTTLSIDDTKEIIQSLQNKFPTIKGPIKEDICYATTNRQAAVKLIAPKCDLFLIIGSRNSSNSQRLVEVAKKNGCENSLLLHTDLEFPEEQILNCKNLGLSSGASAPEILIQNLIKKIKKIRNVQIKEITSATENVTFKIPSTLQ